MEHSSNTVSVIGADGMLGRAVVRALEANAKDFIIHEMGSKDGDPFIVPGPYIINCAGIIRGRTDVDLYRTVKVNTVLPHWLAQEDNLKRMVTISTDCVFDGLDGPYSESSQPTPTDLYSRTKLAGEVLDNEKVLTVRTSFIGFGQRGLLRWLLTQPEGATIEGHRDRMWNGLYVGNVARALVYLCLRKNLSGLIHFSGNVINKSQLLQLLAGRLRPDITILPRDGHATNHVLASNRLDEFDFGQMFETSMRLLAKDYEEWGKDYLGCLTKS